MVALAERPWQQFDEFRMFTFDLFLSPPKISKSPVFGRPVSTRFGFTRDNTVSSWLVKGFAAPEF